jgi:hypothetical protein
MDSKEGKCIFSTTLISSILFIGLSIVELSGPNHVGSGCDKDITDFLIYIAIISYVRVACYLTLAVYVTLLCTTRRCASQRGIKRDKSYAAVTMTVSLLAALAFIGGLSSTVFYSMVDELDICYDKYSTTLKLDLAVEITIMILTMPFLAIICYQRSIMKQENYEKIGDDEIILNS